MNYRQFMEERAKEALSLWKQPINPQSVERLIEISMQLGFNATEENCIQFLNGK